VTTHSEQRHQLGAYLLGALSADDRADVEAHLLDCASCREELSNLSMVPALLLKLDPQRSEPPPSSIGQADSERLARSVALAIERRVRRRRLLGIGAVTLVAALALGYLLVGRTPPPTRVVALSAPAAANGPGAPSGSAALDGRPWGTQIVLTLHRLPAGATFVASIRDSTDQRVIGSWGSTASGGVTVQVATDRHPDAVSGLTVSTSTGRVILKE